MFGRSLSFCCTHRAGLTVALAVAGMVLLSPGRVAASCGNYVQFRDPKAVEMTAEAQHAPSPLVPKRDAPCHGPHCSQRPHRAPFTPVPPPTPAGERWAAPVSWLGSTQPGRTEPAAAPRTAEAIHRTTPPDPPPRLALS